MNNDELPAKGATSDDLKQKVDAMWIKEAGKNGVDLQGLSPNAPLHDRIAWAMQKGLAVATVYSRYSTKTQGSTEDQVRACVEYAARNGMYCPAELLCTDEAKSGRRTERDGLTRVTYILANRHAQVMLVFKLSRLYRQSYRAIQFIREEIVDAHLRAVAVSQAIDTDDKKTWRLQVGVHSLIDEEFLEAVADHVREGLVGLHMRGWTTGALPVGYYPKEVPGAPPTRRKLPRTMPAVDERIAPLIRCAFEQVANGMNITEAWRRYRAADGPTDPRSKKNVMSYTAFRRMLARPAYIGIWQFGRKRNQYYAKTDSIKQLDQPEAEVKVVRTKELRIISDELFLAVQDRLNALKSGPRGPRKSKKPQLWDMVTDVFYCPHCDRRFHTCGAEVAAMHCPNPDCPKHGMVNRKEAVTAICNCLTRLIARDGQLVQQIIEGSLHVDAKGDEQMRAELDAILKKIQKLTRQISDLYDIAGDGTDEDRAEVKARIRATQADRTNLQRQAARLGRLLDRNENPITAEQVRDTLKGFTDLLVDGSGGDLGADAVHRAAEVFHQLVGQRVDVEVHVRPGRKRTVVRSTFCPKLIMTVADANGGADVQSETSLPVTVWLRRPPRTDRIAPIVAYMYDQMKLGFRRITTAFNEAGMKIGCGNIYSSYERHYQMLDRPVPPRRPRS